LPGHDSHASNGTEAVAPPADDVEIPAAVLVLRRQSNSTIAGTRTANRVELIEDLSPQRVGYQLTNVRFLDGYRVELIERP
jgi:hypothetical protein